MRGSIDSILNETSSNSKRNSYSNSNVQLNGVRLETEFFTKTPGSLVGALMKHEFLQVHHEGRVQIQCKTSSLLLASVMSIFELAR